MVRLVPSDVLRRLACASEVIEGRHAESLVLGDIAASAGISPFHFLRLYRQAFGMTPHQHLTKVRLRHARDLLARGRASVTEVCFAVGYESLGSFSTLFARRYGASPAAYRRRVRSLVAVPRDVVRLHVPCCFLAFFPGSQSSRSQPPAAVVR